MARTRISSAEALKQKKEKLEQLISQERNPELQQALEDLDDFMLGY